MNALTVIEPQSNVEAYRASTDAAGMCREIVVATAKNIQGRRYVAVEGWEAIAIAHGCAASALAVERVNDEGASGFKCTGVVRRMADGQEIARGEGFLGDDEPMWAKRPVYARRAMVQTRAISRACRSAFAHVVVLIDKNLSTTPAEEVPTQGFDERNVQQAEYTEVEHPRQDKVEKKALPPGKHGSRTALQAAIRKLKLEGDNVSDRAAFEALMTEYEGDLQQLQADNHQWWTATEYESVPTWIQRRRAELSDEGGMFDALLASMQECETTSALTKWVQRNGDAIDALTDVQRRAFETEYEKRESVIMTINSHN